MLNYSKKPEFKETGKNEAREKAIKLLDEALMMNSSVVIFVRDKGEKCSCGNPDCYSGGLIELQTIKTNDEDLYHLVSAILEVKQGIKVTLLEDWIKEALLSR